MEAATGGQHDTAPTAPAHVIDMLAGVMRPPVRRPGAAPIDPIDQQRRARAEARIYADRIWAEAWHAGAQAGTTDQPEESG